MGVTGWALTTASAVSRAVDCSITVSSKGSSPSWTFSRANGEDEKFTEEVMPRVQVAGKTRGSITPELPYARAAAACGR